MKKIQQAGELYKFLVKNKLLNSKGNLINARNSHPLYSEAKRLILEFTDELNPSISIAVRMRYIKNGILLCFFCISFCK